MGEVVNYIVLAVVLAGFGCLFYKSTRKKWPWE